MLPIEKLKLVKEQTLKLVDNNELSYSEKQQEVISLFKQLNEILKEIEIKDLIEEN